MLTNNQAGNVAEGERGGGGGEGLYDSCGVWESFFFLARVFPKVRELIFAVVV